MTNTLLLVSNDTSVLAYWQDIAAELSCETVLAANGMEALIEIEMKGTAITAVVSALEMPVMNGAEMLQSLKKYHPHIPVILSVNTESLTAAMALMDEGVDRVLDEYFTAEQLSNALKQSQELHKLQSEREQLNQPTSAAMGFSYIIGAERGLKQVISRAKRMAESELPILITGDSGVGKEIFARAIHGESPRRDCAFVAVNCGAIPRNLAESTLFGHVKGSFTGAISDSLGKFREAQGGTLFLDEVGELPLEVQVKLLRALQEGEIEPVGHGKPVKVDVRIISATNVNLASEIGDGMFREDLFYRLNVLPLTLPPLRDRGEDILALAEHFVSKITQREKLPLKKLSSSATEWLQRYHWPGNVREMENTISRALLLAETNEITIDDLNGTAAAMQKIPTNDNKNNKGGHNVSLLREDGSRKTMDEIYQDVINITLKETQQNIALTSSILGVGQSTLYRKLGLWKQES